MEEVHELRPIAAERLPLLNKLTAGIQQHGMLATPSLHWWLGLMLLGALGLPQAPATGELAMRSLPTAPALFADQLDHASHCTYHHGVWWTATSLTAECINQKARTATRWPKRQQAKRETVMVEGHRPLAPRQDLLLTEPPAS